MIDIAGKNRKTSFAIIGLKPNKGATYMSNKIYLIIQQRAVYLEKISDYLAEYSVNEKKKIHSISTIEMRSTGRN